MNAREHRNQGTSSLMEEYLHLKKGFCWKPMTFSEKERKCEKKQEKGSNGSLHIVGPSKQTTKISANNLVACRPDMVGFMMGFRLKAN